MIDLNLGLWSKHGISLGIVLRSEKWY